MHQLEVSILQGLSFYTILHISTEGHQKWQEDSTTFLTFKYLTNWQNWGHDAIKQYRVVNCWDYFTNIVCVNVTACTRQPLLVKKREDILKGGQDGRQNASLIRWRHYSQATIVWEQRHQIRKPFSESDTKGNVIEYHDKQPEADIHKLQSGAPKIIWI